MSTVETPTAQTFIDVVQRLYAEKFTGETVIRWAQGHPRIVEFPCEPTRIVLDARPQSGADLTA